jgi:hypothetical protein
MVKSPTFQLAGTLLRKVPRNVLTLRGMVLLALYVLSLAYTLYAAGVHRHDQLGNRDMGVHITRAIPFAIWFATRLVLTESHLQASKRYLKEDINWRVWVGSHLLATMVASMATVLLHAWLYLLIAHSGPSDSATHDPNVVLDLVHTFGIAVAVGAAYAAYALFWRRHRGFAWFGLLLDLFSTLVSFWPSPRRYALHLFGDGEGDPLQTGTRSLAWLLVLIGLWGIASLTRILFATRKARSAANTEQLSGN